jgi:SAM-dependent methyltransferase
MAAVDVLEHNRRAWNRQSRRGCVWSQPVSPETIAQARVGVWSVVLTPVKPVPHDWFGDVRGRQVLCLASGGGQQAPILAAAGARVTSYDLSDEQLERDREVALRESLDIVCVRGDMADLSQFADDRFELIFHPVSNVFAPDVVPVWRECHRVLRSGGALLAGFMNPAIYLFDDGEVERTGELVVRRKLPFSDLADLPPDVLERRIAAGEPLEFSHSLETQIGGQLAAGFVLTHFFEDRWLDDTFAFSRHSPIAFATRAVKPPLEEAR